ncbi:MAG: acyl-CoA thioesterase [Panacagrimonas sp.]
MSNEPWNEAELEGALRLDPLGNDRFVNPRLSLNMNGMLFGGQFIANTLSAAQLTAGSRVPRSFQGVFMRPGRPDSPLELDVERVHDGARLSHRRVRMIQAGRTIFMAQVYLGEAAATAGQGHQSMPAGLAINPDTLAETQELAERYRDRINPTVHARMVRKKAVLVKPLNPEFALVSRAPEPRLAIWLKPAVAVSSEPLMQYAALAFFSDYWLCWPSRSPYVETVLDRTNSMSSLDHSMWFHAEPCVDDWLLYEVESPFADGNFGLGRGALYDRGGRLLASSAQQCLLT